MPGPGLGSLTNLGDLRNVGKDFKEQEFEEPVISPGMALILEDPNLDPETKAILRNSEQRRIQIRKLKIEQAKIQAEKDNPSLFAKIGGIPVGLQVGTFFKVDHWLPRLIMDLVIDPVNLLGGVGSVSKAGRIGRFLAGVSPAAKAEALVDAASVFARNVDDVKLADQFLDTLRGAQKSGNYNDLVALFKAQAKKSVPRETIDFFREKGGAFSNIADIVQNRGQVIDDLTRAFSVEDKLATFAQPAAKSIFQIPSVIDDIRTGQRSVVSFGLPFSSHTFGEYTLQRSASQETFQAVVDSAGFDAGQAVFKNFEDFAQTTGTVGAKLGRGGAHILDNRPAGIVRAIAKNPEDVLTVGNDFVLGATKRAKAAEIALKAASGARKSIRSNIARIAGASEKIVDDTLSIITGEDKTRREALELVENVFNPKTFRGGSRTKEEAALIKKFKDNPGTDSLKALLETGGGQKLVSQYVDARNAETLLEDAGVVLKSQARSARDFQSQLSRVNTELVKATSGTGTPKAIKRQVRKITEVLGLSPHETAQIARSGGDKTKINTALGEALARQSARFKFSKVTPAGAVLPGRRAILPKGTARGLPARQKIPTRRSPLDVDGTVETLSKQADEGPPSRPPDGPGSAPPGGSTGLPGDDPLAVERINDIFDRAEEVLTGSSTLRAGGHGLKKMLESGERFGRSIQRQRAATEFSVAEISNEMIKVFPNEGDLVDLFRDSVRSPSAFRAARANMTVAQQVFVEKYQGLMKAMLQEAKDSNVLKDGLSNYFTNIFKFSNISEQNKLRALNQFLGKHIEKYKFSPGDPGNRFGIERTFKDVEEAEAWIARNTEFSVALDKNIDGVAVQYLRSMGGAITRNQALRAAEQMPYKISKGSDEIAIPWAVNTTRIAETLPKDMQKIVEQAIKDDEYFKVTNNPIFDNYLVVKEFKKDLESLFSPDLMTDSRFSDTAFGSFIRGVNTINSIGKASMLSLNPFFHGVNIFYSSTALLGIRESLGITGRTLDITSARDIGRRIADITGELFNRKTAEELAREDAEMLARWGTALRSGTHEQASRVFNGDLLREFQNWSGLSLGRPAADTGFDVFNRFLSAVAGDLPELPHPFLKFASRAAVIPGVKPLAKTWRHINVWSDRLLWSKLKDGFTVNGWAEVRNRVIRREMAAGTEITDDVLRRIDAESGQIVAQAFGGSFDRLLIDPNFKLASRNFMLAPDWTLGNIRMAVDMVANMPGVGKILTPDSLMRDERFHFALAYNLRAAFYIFTFGNIANYTFTKMNDGEGRFIWENGKEAFDPEIGINTRIELPWQRSDGRKQYADITKQFSEPWRMFLSPGAAINRKMGPLPRMFQTGIVGIDSFGNSVKGLEGGPFEQTTARIFGVTGQFAPIPVRAAQGVFGEDRSAASAVIQSFLGFGTKTESREGFRKRKNLEEIDQKLKLLNYTKQ